jgi:hypothetical protein
MKKIGTLISLVCAIVIATVIGCGGGGGGSVSGGGTVPVGVFLTDNYRDGFDQLWMTVVKVEALANDDTATTIFEDSAGKEVNARRLYNGTSLYSFLNQVNLPADKTINRIRIRVKNEVKSLATGASNFTTFTVNGDAVGGSTDKTITFNLTTPKVFAAGDDFAIDFDLAAFTAAGGVMTCVIKEGNRNGINSSGNHVDDDVKGVVSNLNPTAGTFTLTRLSGATLNVSYTSTTAIFNSNGTPNPVLANAKTVEVRGYLDPTTALYVASAIKIKANGELEDEDKAVGTVTAKNAGAGTITLETAWTRGFIPATRTVTISTNGSTVFRANRGVIIPGADFYTGLEIGSFIEAEGMYTVGTNTLAARKVKYESPRDGKHNGGPGLEAEAYGTGSNLNASAGTLTLTLSSWEGFAGSNGLALSVTTNGSTEYKDANNENVSKTQFFALIGSNTIKAEGQVTGTTMAAQELKIRNDD